MEVIKMEIAINAEPQVF